MPLDFEVVGGSAYGSDIFVASVKSESMPDKAGLLVGDQVRGDREGRDGTDGRRGRDRGGVRGEGGRDGGRKEGVGGGRYIGGRKGGGREGGRDRGGGSKAWLLLGVLMRVRDGWGGIKGEREKLSWSLRLSLKLLFSTTLIAYLLGVSIR